MHPGKEPSEPCPWFTYHSVKLCELLHEKNAARKRYFASWILRAVIFAPIQISFLQSTSRWLKILVLFTVRYNKHQRKNRYGEVL